MRVGWIKCGALAIAVSSSLTTTSCTDAPGTEEQAESGDDSQSATQSGTEGSDSQGSDSQGSVGTDSGSATQTSTDSSNGSGETTDGSDTNGTGTDTGPGEDAQKLEFRVDGFNVPISETYYACFEFELTLEQLGHIIQFEPVLDNSAYVHHFVLTEIEGPSGSPDGYQCFDLAGDVLWAWAPGQGTFELPEEAGFLIGDRPGGKTTLRLQVHYNNPLNATGEVDNSGFDMWVTKQLRAENAGTLIFGDIQGIEIPPGQSDYEHIMTCRSEVTAAEFGEPLHVFGVTNHAHEIGKVLYTEVWRDGEMVMELNRDDPYLFDSQHIKFVDAVLEPGDEIRHHCIYDSTARKNVTMGGPGTQDEMCWDTIIYYPRIPSGFDWCTSFN